MLNPSSTRVAHSFAFSAKGWGIARCATVLLMAVMASGVRAQAADCLLSGIRHSASLGYPMIGQAAHVTGDIRLIAAFASNGSVASVNIVSGPEMLRKTATDYVNSWQVNETESGQQCPVTISFKIDGEASCSHEPSVARITDLQHFTVTVRPVQTCDPSASISSYIQHRFLFLRWKTNAVRHINE